MLESCLAVAAPASVFSLTRMKGSDLEAYWQSTDIYGISQASKRC